MIKKNTLILLIVMLIMVGAFFLLQRKDALGFLTKKDEATPIAMPQFVSLETSLIESIQFSTAGEENVIVSKQSNDGWEINVPGGVITEGNIEAIITEFNSIETTVILSVDLEGGATGLDNPQFIFTLVLSNGERKTIKIGNSNPMGSGYYAQEDLNQVVLIPKGGIDNICEIFQLAVTPSTPTPAPTEIED